AEEVFGGAKPMIEAGVLEQPRVEEIYGLHLTTQTPVGHVGIRPGPAMASADFFDIDIQGKGGHGAYPHLSIDPITVAANILLGMKTWSPVRWRPRKPPSSPSGKSSPARSITSSLPRL